MNVTECSSINLVKALRRAACARAAKLCANRQYRMARAYECLEFEVFSDSEVIGIGLPSQAHLVAWTFEDVRHELPYEGVTVPQSDHHMLIAWRPAA